MSLPNNVVYGDCVEVMRILPDCSVDSVVCDPPYGLEFMGAAWDAPWKHGMGKLGYSDGGNRAPRPNHFSTRNPVCLACHKHKRGTDRCQCPSPDFDESQADSSRLLQEWCEAWARECLRVLKPGAHLIAFGGTRTYHRMVCAIEDAGFEIRDSLHWLYGSGFPKSRDVGKDIDKMAGAEREVVGYDATRARPNRLYESGAIGNIGGTGNISDRTDNGATITAPATVAAKQWDGWGTALKPGHEPIVLARKPLAGTVAANVMAHGTGALNVGACRVAGVPRSVPQPDFSQANHATMSGLDAHARNGEMSSAEGRWPPNVLFTHFADCVPLGAAKVAGTKPPGSRGGSRDLSFGMKQQGQSEMPFYTDPNGTETVQAWDCAPDCPVAGLDGQSGKLKSGAWNGVVNQARSSQSSKGAESERPRADRQTDVGGASRFYPQFTWDPVYDLPFLYNAKAKRSERPELPDGYKHPTVKPLSLMSWLVRLVTPPGGLVLDPFGGTGTTGLAALGSGMRFTLAENDTQHIELMKVRLKDFADDVGYWRLTPESVPQV